MFNLVAREPWAEDLLALVERENAVLVERGRGDEGMIPLIQGNQALLRQMCDLSMREITRLREDVTKGDLALRAVVASFQSFVNEARRGEAPSIPLAPPPLLSEKLDTMGTLCRAIELYSTRFKGREPSAKEKEKWLTKLEDGLFELSKRPLLERSVFDEERIEMLVRMGRISPSQEYMLRNEPMSSRLLGHYVALKKTHPDYDPDNIQLEEIKATFIGPEILERLSVDHFKNIYDTLLPLVTKITTQVGEELLEVIWRKRSFIQASMVIICKESYDKIDLNIRSLCDFIDILQQRRQETYLKERKNRFFIDIGLPLSKMLEVMETSAQFPIIYPQVTGAEGAISLSHPLCQHRKCAKLYLAQRLNLGDFSRTYQFKEEKEQLLVEENFNDLVIFRHKIPMSKKEFETKGLKGVDFTDTYAKWADKARTVEFGETLPIRDKIKELRAQAEERVKRDPEFTAAVEKLEGEWKKIVSIAEYYLIEVKESEWGISPFSVWTGPEIAFFSELEKEYQPTFIDKRFN
ncbi:MAG: hypothetical protein KBC64_00860 [Simkaniaceae bacterium]|nr:hypothetical protein [Simkaniaceae bacterium]